MCTIDKALNKLRIDDRKIDEIFKIVSIDDLLYLLAPNYVIIN